MDAAEETHTTEGNVLVGLPASDNYLMSLSFSYILARLT